jgi:hypothetical protein
MLLNHVLMLGSSSAKQVWHVSDSLLPQFVIDATVVERTSLESYCFYFLKNCVTITELCLLVSWQVYVVWVIAYQHTDVGHCFFRFIAGVGDDSGAPVSSG